MPAETADIPESRPPAGPLNGLRILELGHFIAGPFCARLMADLGAEVIKVEPPGTGDQFRTWGFAVKEGSLWWSVHARNKKSVSLNLRHPEGQAIARRLVGQVDVVVENFRPGQLERWGLGWEDIQRENPRCILARISGYGQDGPYRDRVAFGAIGETMGGIRHLTGHPPQVSELPPVRTGVALADDLAAVYAMAGILAAVHERDVAGTGRGRLVDVALYEAIFSFMEAALPEYGYDGRVRQPSGSTMPTAAPSNTYRTRDGLWLVIAGNSDQIFARLARVIGRPELPTDPRFSDNQARLRNRDALDDLITEWTVTQDAAEAERILLESDVPAGRAYTIRDCAEDPHFHARGMIRKVPDPRFGHVLQPGVIPKFNDGGPAGGVAWAGPEVGQHNREVYGRLLGLGEGDLARLAAEGVI